jgi:hypothetical protein
MSEVTPMTPLGSSLFDFASQPYPASPEREKEIERLHRLQRSHEADECRAQLLGFIADCQEGKHGRMAEDSVNETIQGATYTELIDPRGTNCAPNLINLVLWDARRRVAWASARARGDMVPERLKSREECLAVHKARKFADEKYDYNAPVKKPIPESYIDNERDDEGFGF